MEKVRVDFFKRSGKWYCTEEMVFLNYSEDINLSFAKSLSQHLSTGLNHRLDDMVAVCLNPTHPFSHPVMMPVENIYSMLTIDESHQAESPEDDVVWGY